MYQLTFKSVRNIPPIASESFDEVVIKATELRDSDLGKYVQSVIFGKDGKLLWSGTLPGFIEWAKTNAPADEQQPGNFPYAALKAHARTCGIQGWFSNNHSAVLPAGGLLFAARSLLADSERKVGKQFRRIVVHYDLNGKRQKFDTKDPSVIAKFIGRSATPATKPATASRLAIENPADRAGFYTVRLVAVSEPGTADVVQTFERMADAVAYVKGIVDTEVGRRFVRVVVTDVHGFQIFGGGLAEFLVWASGKPEVSEAPSSMRSRNRAFAAKIKQRGALDLTAALKAQGRRRQKVAAG